MSSFTKNLGNSGGRVGVEGRVARAAAGGKQQGRLWKRE